MRIFRTVRRRLIVITLLAALSVATASTQGRRFYDDDPIARDADTEDASKAKAWDVGLFYDLTVNLFVTAGRTPTNTRAQNVNTVDEVPDSSWFTNRSVSALPVDQLVRGPNVGPPPAYRWRNLSKNLNDGKTTQGSVDIVIAEGSGIRLIMPVPPKDGASRPSEEE